MIKNFFLNCFCLKWVDCREKMCCIESLTKLLHGIAVSVSILFGQVACGDFQLTLGLSYKCVPHVELQNHKQMQFPDMTSLWSALVIICPSCLPEPSPCAPLRWDPHGAYQNPLPFAWNDQPILSLETPKHSTTDSQSVCTLPSPPYVVPWARLFPSSRTCGGNFSCGLLLNFDSSSDTLCST